MNKDKKIAAYDLETIARPLSDEVINELCKTGNLQDSAKIAEKRAEFRGKLGINPLTAMPCCGGWYSSEEDSGYMMLNPDASPASEKAFLRDYLAKLSQFDILVGFNCFSFDSKILMIRSAVHGVDIPFKFDRRRYSSSGNHIDIRMVLQDWNTFEAGKLGFFLDMFGLEGKTKGIDGSMVQDYWDNGLHQDIGEYCLQDCKQTMALFERIKRYFL